MSGSLDTVIQGQAATFSANFYNSDGTSFAPATPVTYVIRDDAGNLVVQGTAAQDIVTTSRWYASITIPSTAPVSSQGTRYTLFWTAVNALNNSQVITDHFTVKAAADFNVLELDRLALTTSLLVDSIACDSNNAITSFELIAQSQEGQVIYDSGIVNSSSSPPLPTPVTSGSKFVYTWQSTQTIKQLLQALGTWTNSPDSYPWPPIYGLQFPQIGSTGYTPIIMQWNLTFADGTTSQEFHFLYIVNPKIIGYVHTLRRTIDKARSQNPNPILQYTDVDLVEYCNQGVTLVNLAKPTLTNWSLLNVPNELRYGVQAAAAYCALSAQYLAEGESAFEFSGQSVSLSVDRSQFIDTALARFAGFVEEQIPAAKRMWVRSTGGTGQAAGVLGVSIGPMLGWTSQGYRYDMYRKFLAGI